MSRLRSKPSLIQLETLSELIEMVMTNAFVIFVMLIFVDVYL